MFSTRRKIHQNVTSAEVTGGIPDACFLAGAKHIGDITNTGDGAQEAALGYRAWTFGWLGCLDAPELLPAGSVRPVNISPEIGGMGYEGNVASSVQRG